MQQLTVLDNTLRDGSYAIGFSFTATQTSALCRDLEHAGVSMIEIGHGAGVGATAKGLNPAAASDPEYLRAAAGALECAAFGVFCIPGVAELDDVQRAIDEGIGFLRVGTDVTRVAESRPFIDLAKRHGVFTTANLMKSYAVPPEEFAAAAALSASFGADVVYLVDSAGTLFPEDVRTYLEALQARSSVSFGFHGHDNLGVANYNTLLSADLGATLVDGSLQGLGRSAGNAATELIVVSLEKRGYDTGIDGLQLLRAGEVHARPLLGPGGFESVDVVSGLAGFHSNFLPKVLEAADRYGVEPEHLIVDLCEVDRCSVQDDDLRRIALARKASAARRAGAGEPPKNRRPVHTPLSRGA